YPSDSNVVSLILNVNNEDICLCNTECDSDSEDDADYLTFGDIDDEDLDEDDNYEPALKKSKTENQ
ncbi:unnamed protein product, partial [Didymodactylos carnosus]